MIIHQVLLLWVSGRRRRGYASAYSLDYQWHEILERKVSRLNK